MDDDEGHGPIRWTGGPQPHITHARHVRALTPGPLALLLQVLPLDLVPIGQCEGVGTLPFHEERALVGRRDMAHELRIAKPAIRHDHLRGQLYAASAEGCHASIQHDLHPVQFITARRPRPWRVGPPDGKVHGHHQLTIANDHNQENPVNTREYPMFLATPPGTHQAQLITVFFEHRVIADPGPLPAAACGLTRAGDVTP
jgi:hypothetical protein